MGRRGGRAQRRRILAAQLDGASRRLDAMRSTNGEDIEGQTRRVRDLEDEIERYDRQHGTAPEDSSGGLWGSSYPQRHGNDLFSSGADHCLPPA